MTKPKKNTIQGPDKKVNIFLALSVVVLTLFSFYSGGEFLGLLTVLIILFVSYKIARYSFDEIYFEKLFFITVGIYFTLTSMLGFTLLFLGFNLSVRNFLILAIIAAAVVIHLTKERKPSTVKIDKKRLLLIGGAFFIAFFIYLWPSLPSFASPCTCGFDCTLHMEYMANIYSLEHAIPPIKDWRYYPNGFHINGALLAHALEPDMPSYGSISYPFTAFMAAMVVGILSGMIYDRLKNKLYVLIFLLAMLATVYPASALVGFGFWANFFGMYYVVFFAWALSDFIEKPKDKRMMTLLLLIAVGSIIAYQILTSLILIISFILASLTLIKVPLKDKVKLALTFLIVFGIFYGIYTIEAYSRYLSYLDSPISSYNYFADYTPKGLELNKGYLDMRLDGTKIHIKGTGLHVEEIYVSPGVKISELLSKGLNIETIKSFLDVGKQNISGPSGNALFFDLKWFGLITILLMMFGLASSYTNREYTLIFMEASIIHLFIFSAGMKTGDVNLYYYSKMMYFFIYPVTLYAIVGLEELFSRLVQSKKKAIVFAVLLLFMTSFSLNLINKNQVGILVGEKKDLYEGGQYWSLLEFNRFLRYLDMSWGVKRDSYGLAGYLEMMNISTRQDESIEELSDISEIVYEGANSELRHSLGQQSGDSDWVAMPGEGYQYMVYGPYVELDSGKYDVVYRLKINEPAEDSELVGALDISENSGHLVLIKKDLYGRDFPGAGTYAELHLAFETDKKLKDVEFRVHYPNSNVGVTLDKITLKIKEK